MVRAPLLAVLALAQQALVHAASVLSTRNPRDPQQVLRVDICMLVLHLLDGLQRAGIERAVVVLGEDGDSIVRAVQEAPDLRLMVNYVHAPPSTWCSLANSIRLARAAFATSDEPLLIVRAERIEAPSLPRKQRTPTATPCAPPRR